MTPNQIENLRDLWASDLQLDATDPGPIPILNDRPERTWIWSDLHLGDRGALEAFGRPFEQVDQMNGHLICEWCRRVREDETIICLGDIADREAWRDRRLRVHVRGCPGRKILVLGNHDAELESETLREVGFELCQPGAVRHRPAAGAEPRPAAPAADWHRQSARTPARRNRADEAAHQPRGRKHVVQAAETARSPARGGRPHRAPAVPKVRRPGGRGARLAPSCGPEQPPAVGVGFFGRISRERETVYPRARPARAPRAGGGPQDVTASTAR